MAFSKSVLRFSYKDQDGDVFTLVFRRPSTDELLDLRNEIRHCRTRKGDVDLNASSEVVLKFFDQHVEDFLGSYIDPDTGKAVAFSKAEPIPPGLLATFGLKENLDICTPMVREHAVTKLFILVDDDVEEPLRKKSVAASKAAAKT